MNEPDLTSLEAFREGLLVLTEPAGGGLACVIKGCDNPKCMCREVQLRAIPFGRWVHDVRLDQGDLRFSVDETKPEAADLGHPVDLKLDVDHGNLLDDDGEPVDIEAQPRLKILEQTIDGPFLDEMARRLLRHKGLKIEEGARYSKLDLDHWSPGDNVYWEEVFQEVRQDVYLSGDGESYSAGDMYCPDPDCACGEAGVSFLGEDGDVGMVRVELESGKVKFEPKASHESLLQTLWRSFHQRHHGIAHLKQRDIEMKKFGAEVLFARPDTVQPVTVRREQSKVGRNESCPCGSGKKYKKCCLRKSA